jgi:hypothetical protein
MMSGASVKHLRDGGILDEFAHAGRNANLSEPPSLGGSHFQGGQNLQF